MPLVGLEAAIRAAASIGEAPEGGDALDSAFGTAALLVGLLYDPITTRLFGATPGKRARGLTVMRTATSEPAGPFMLAGRTAIQIVLWALCAFPGILNMKQMGEHHSRQGWHDQAIGTVVVRTSKRRANTVDPAPALGEPWQSIVEEARAAQRRFTGATSVTAKGPIRERMADLQREVQRSVTECEKAAMRGSQLADLTKGVDVEEAEARAGAARELANLRPNDTSASDLADALENESESARRVHELVLTTERKVRVLVSQLSDAANRAAEVAMDRTDTTSVDSLIDELAALHAGLAEAAEIARQPLR